MSTAFEVFIITKDSGFADKIETALAGMVLSVRSVAETDLTHETPVARSIVFLDARNHDSKALSLIARLKRTGDEVRVVVVSQSRNPESVLESMRAGASDYLAYPVDPEEIAGAVRRIAEQEEGGAGRGRIVAVFSLKGGQGTTSLAANLADHIHSLTRETCLLADLNLYMGHVCVGLDLPCAYTPFDLVSDLDRADDNLLFSSLVRHERGFHVLGISDLIADASEITGDELNAMLRLLRQHLPYTVLDLPHDLSERALAGLDAADRILLVVQQDVPSLKSAQLALRVFSDLDYETDRIGVVVNRYVERNGIELEDIESSLKRPVITTVSNDYRTMATVFNRGQTVDSAERRSRLNEDFARLAGLVTGMPPRIGKRRGWRKLLPI